jgi:hypothetical protein
MKKVTYTYHLDEKGGYHGVTSTSPDGFSGALYVGMGPKPDQGPESVHEQAYSVRQVQKWKSVDLVDVPKEWCEAIGYEEQPEPTPEPDLKFVIKDGPPRSEKLAELVKKMEAGMVLPEQVQPHVMVGGLSVPVPTPEPDPEPEPGWMHKPLHCQFNSKEPWKDPLFWPLAILSYIILSSIFKGCI